MRAKRENRPAGFNAGLAADASPAADNSPGGRGWRKWWGLALLLLTLEVAVFSVEQARWIAPQPWLTLVFFLSAAAAVLLVWSRLPAWAAHVLAMAAGLLVTAWQAVRLLPPVKDISGVAHLLNLIKSVGNPESTLNSGEQTIGFVIFIVLVIWIAGYLSTWFLLRRQNAWVGTCLGALVLLVNLSNLSSSHYIYFLGYFFLSLLLISWMRIYRQNMESARGPGFPRKFWIYLTAALLCIAVVAGSVSWFTPQARAPGLQTAIATATFWKKNVIDSNINVLNSVPAKQPTSTTRRLDSLELGETWNQTDRVEFTVKSAQASYWQTHVYDIYQDGVWSNLSVGDYILEKNKPWSGPDTTSSREMLTYEVETEINTDILLNGGSFVSADTSSVLYLSAGEVVGVAAPRVLVPGEHYTVTVTIPRTTPEMLAGAGENYPPPALENYLHLPADFSQKVRDLSLEITAGATSPYQKVTAIYDYLSQIPYSTQINAAPDGADDIEYFLFTQKSGFCAYFASAMSLMLRAAGVPARLATGYLPGEPGDQPGEYLLPARSYHAWSQVYFPGFGWVDVEATPGSSQGTGSAVAIETPWVSAGIADASPPNDYWQEYLASQGDPRSGGTVQVIGQAPSQRIRGPLAFADELGKALIIIFLSALVIFALGLPFIFLRRSFFRWLWRVDRPALASMVYDRMIVLGNMVGITPKPQQTPMEYAAQVAEAFPQQEEHINHIARIYTENRFGRRGRLGLFEEAELLKARCRIYETMLKRKRFRLTFPRRYGQTG